MNECWIVFRRWGCGVCETVGEFLACSPALAVTEAQDRHGYSDDADYWAVPSAWWKDEALEGILEGALQ